MIPDVDIHYCDPDRDLLDMLDQAQAIRNFDLYGHDSAVYQYQPKFNVFGAYSNDISTVQTLLRLHQMIRKTY